MFNREAFGQNIGEDLIPPEEGYSDCGPLQPKRKVLILTEPSPGIKMIGGKGNWLLSKDRVVVKEQQPSGFWAIAMLHLSRIIRIKW